MDRLVKLLFLCTIIFSLVFVSSCSRAGLYQRNVYEDEQKISAIGDSYSYTNKTGSVEEDRLLYEIKGFYGKDTVWEIVADDECIINLNVSADIKSGKFKLCLVSNDSVVTTIFENSQDGVYPVTLTAGTNRVIMVGCKASGSVNVLLPEDIADKPVTVKPIQN